jgi:hypothetical protein
VKRADIIKDLDGTYTVQLFHTIDGYWALVSKVGGLQLYSSAEAVQNAWLNG